MRPPSRPSWCDLRHPPPSEDSPVRRRRPPRRACGSRSQLPAGGDETGPQGPATAEPVPIAPTSPQSTPSHRKAFAAARIGRRASSGAPPKGAAGKSGIDKNLLLPSQTLPGTRSAAYLRPRSNDQLAGSVEPCFPRRCLGGCHVMTEQELCHFAKVVVFQWVGGRPP